MTRVLPYQAQTLICGKIKHVVIAVLVPAKLVAVQENRSDRVTNIAVTLFASDLLTCQFNERERISPARPE